MHTFLKNTYEMDVSLSAKSSSGYCMVYITYKKAEPYCISKKKK